MSSALGGLDVPGLLAGAAAMDERCRSAPFDENPALVYAALQFLMQEKKGKPMSVTFSYSQRLALVADAVAVRVPVLVIVDAIRVGVTGTKGGRAFRNAAKSAASAG